MWCPLILLRITRNSKKYRGGNFKIEVIFFPRGAPRGDPRGVSPGVSPGGSPGSCSGFPSGEKNLRIRPRGYFFMLRSILILPDLEIPLKCQKIMKKRSCKKSNCSNCDQIMIWGYGSAWFFTLIPNPTSKPPQTMLKTRFYQKCYFYGTSISWGPLGSPGVPWDPLFFVPWARQGKLKVR